MRLQSQYEENQNLRQAWDQLQTNCKNITAHLNERSAQSEALLAEKLTLKAKVSTLEAKCSQLEGRCTEQADELTRLKRDRGAWQENSSMQQLKTNDPNSGSAAENMELKLTIKELNMEQENLLTLLQDMEQKLVRYKKLLRLCGQDRELSESDDDDDDDGGEEDGETDGMAKSNGAAFLHHVPQINQASSKRPEDICRALDFL